MGYCVSCAWAGDSHKCAAAAAPFDLGHFERLALARSRDILDRFVDGRFIVPAPYDTIGGAISLLESIMAENLDDRLR
jgi:hypothetical protein